MKSHKDMIVLAVQYNADGEVITNPPNDLVINASDVLLVISKKSN
jgi:hypothetical protein